MKLGAQPKKLIILGVLVVVLAVAIVMNATSDDRPPAARAAVAASRPTARTVPAEIAAEPPAPEPRSRSTAHPESRQLRLNMKDQHADPATVDPTIRIDLLTKVQTVNLAGGERNLFQFGAAPPPPVKPEAHLFPKLPPSGTASTAPEIQSQLPEVKVPPPPVPFKLYGYATNPRTGTKKAFFLQGDDIVVAAEGEVIERRYKVVRIGIDSCVVEDTEFKNQQTLKLEEQQPG
ncbi:MAG: hypothetical protein ACLQGV_17945 [Bryobacteraceae bacterium]